MGVATQCRTGDADWGFALLSNLSVRGLLSRQHIHDLGLLLIRQTNPPSEFVVLDQVLDVLLGFRLQNWTEGIVNGYLLGFRGRRIAGEGDDDQEQEGEQLHAVGRISSVAEFGVSVGRWSWVWRRSKRYVRKYVLDEKSYLLARLF